MVLDRAVAPLTVLIESDGSHVSRLKGEVDGVRVVGLGLVQDRDDGLCQAEGRHRVTSSHGGTE